MSLLVALFAGCERDSANEFLMTTTTLESSSALSGPDEDWQPDGAPEAGGAAPPAFTREQLEQLVAPIALYPDALLMEILMAATYPAEVAEAAIWAKEHPSLVGKELDDAIADKNWDVSVKAVTHAPKALELMAADPQWTRDLGDAFLAQQNDLLNAVQVMRQKACDAGNLKTTEQQQVVIEDAPPPSTQPAPATYVVPPPQQVVRILPVQQNVFYVPVYNPRVIYGPPPPTIYYPRAWLYPSFRVGLAPVISFGVGLTIGALLWGDADWYHGRVYHRDRWYDHRHDYYRYGRPYRGDYWRHDPYHRRGISYPTRYVERNIFERRDDGRERYVRGSRDFEGRLPRSGGWSRALSDDRRDDRLRDWQRDRERTDRDRDRRLDGGDRDRAERERFGADRRGPDRPDGDRDRDRDRDRVDRERRPSREGDRSAIDRRGDPGRERGPDGRGPSRGSMDRGDRGPDRTMRGPDRGPNRAQPDRAQPDRGPSRGPADGGGRGPDRAQSDRGPGRDADRPDMGRGGGPDRDRPGSQARPGGDRDEGSSPGRGGPPRSPGVSGRGPGDGGRSQATRPDRPSQPQANRGPAYRSPGGDRSRGPQGGGRSSDRSADRPGGPPSMDRGGRGDSGSPGGAPSMQRGGRGDPGSRGGSSMQRDAPGSRGGSSMQRSQRGGPQQRGGGGSRGGGSDSRGNGGDSRGDDRGRGR